ncbi:MAG: hypothetical protein PVG96_18105, partial [Desulfobacterales bacterium]
MKILSSGRQRDGCSTMLLKLNDNKSPLNSDYLFAKRAGILRQSGTQGHHSIADCLGELFEKEKP